MAAAVVVGWAAIRAGGRLVGRVVVEGASMSPCILPGDRLIVLKAAIPRRGDVVALADPTEPSRILVKRLADAGPDGLVVLGDNEAASTDSRHFGPVARGSVIGRVIYRYLPPERAGRLQ